MSGEPRHYVGVSISQAYPLQLLLFIAPIAPPPSGCHADISGAGEAIRANYIKDLQSWLPASCIKTAGQIGPSGSAMPLTVLVS